MFQLKDVCRRELDRSEIENVRNQAVTSEYKQVDSTTALCCLMCVHTYVGAE